MDATEARLWRRMMGAWDGFGVRTEASLGEVAAGTPDSLMQPRGLGGVWVELKVWPTPLEPIQYAWHVDCAQRGGTALVFCQVGKDEFWVGNAERYYALKIRPAGVSLQSALASVRFAVVSKK